jgi:hypothetical protein
VLDLVASELAELSDAGAVLASLQANLPPAAPGNPSTSNPGGLPAAAAAAREQAA